MLVLAVRITWSLSPCLLDFAILGFQLLPGLPRGRGRVVEAQPTVQIVFRIGGIGSFPRQTVQNMPNAWRSQGCAPKATLSLASGARESLLWTSKEAVPQEGWCEAIRYCHLESSPGLRHVGWVWRYWTCQTGAMHKHIATHLQ